MVDASLRGSGRSVGRFTSPHLERITERIVVNDREIEPTRLEQVARRIEPILRNFADRGGPSFIPAFFEVLMLVALRTFIDEGVAIAVVEAGIGGRDDATAVLPARVSTVTSVGLDHGEKLGLSLEQIAAEKAGIADAGTALIVGPGIDAGLRQLMRNALAGRGIRLVPVDREAGFATATTRANPAVPPYQRENVATAQATIDAFARHTCSQVPPVAYVQSPGRFEFFRGVSTWLLDGAHNAHAIGALIEGLSTGFGATDRVLIFGASRDKAYARYMHRLPEIARRIFVTDDFHNAVDCATLVAALRRETGLQATPLHTGLRRAIQTETIGGGRELAVVTGSMFLVGRIRSLLSAGGGQSLSIE